MSIPAYSLVPPPPESDIGETNMKNGIPYACENGGNRIKRKPVGSATKSAAQTSDGLQKQVSKGHDTKWTRKFFRVGPLLGIGALFLIILSIPAAAAILVSSNGQRVSSWKYSPNVYLAIMTAFTSKATSLSALQGAVIAWWLNSLKGSTFEQLHQDWKMGQNIWDAITAGRRTNMIALACIFASIAAIDAPLLQRASSVRSKVPNISTPLNMSLVPELPGYYSGQLSYTDSDSFASLDPNPDFYPVMIDWINQKAIPSVGSGCPGSCSVTVQAPMLAKWNCSTSSKYINYTQPLSGNLTWEQQLVSPELANRTAFLVQSTAGTGFGEREFVYAEVGMSDAEATQTCGGMFNLTACYFASAIGEYDLIVTKNETTFLGSQVEPRFVAWANNTAVTNETNSKYRLSTVNSIQYNANYNSTLAGIGFASNLRYQADLTFVPIAWPYHPDPTGLSSFVVQYIKDYIAFNRGSACIPQWIDPWQDIISGLNELMLRTAIHASRPENRQFLESQQYVSLDPGVKTYYEAQGNLSSPESVFESDFLFFFGAALVQLVCVITILYTFCGWWRLGRTVSFSPLEVAKAFEAPLLAGMNSNSNADDMGKAMGSAQLRYGAIGYFQETVAAHEAQRLAFGDPRSTGIVKPPYGCGFEN